MINKTNRIKALPLARITKAKQTEPVPTRPQNPCCTEHFGNVPLWGSKTKGSKSDPARFVYTVKAKIYDPRSH
jgi:hypothetical protein